MYASRTTTSRVHSFGFLTFPRVPPMKTIYIGHPLMGSTPEAHKQGWGDPEKNVERYLRFTAWASNSGYAVISWVHHYLMHTRGLTQGDADFYLSRDKRLLEPADFFWQAGPVEMSSGLLFEVEACKEFGIPVIRDLGWDDPTYLPDPKAPLTPNVVTTTRLYEVERGLRALYLQVAPEQVVESLIDEGHLTLSLIMAVRERWGLSLLEARQLVEPRLTRR